MTEKYGARYRPHEIVWIRAAASLTGRARRQALTDIADMTGRPRDAIRYKAREIAAKPTEVADKLALHAFRTAGSGGRGFVPCRGRGPRSTPALAAKSAEIATALD